PRDRDGELLLQAVVGGRIGNARLEHEQQGEHGMKDTSRNAEGGTRNSRRASRAGLTNRQPDLLFRVPPSIRISGRLSDRAPPTSRLTAAMPASRYLNVSVVCWKVARMSVWLRIWKSLSCPGRILCWRRSTRSISIIARFMAFKSVAWAVMLRNRSVPMRR